MDYVINDCGAKLLVVGEDLRGSIDKIRGDLTGVEHIINVTPEGGERATSTRPSWPRPPLHAQGPEVSPDDVCVIMYSSGTTGKPKGIELTQANLIAHTLNSATFEFEEDDKTLVAMPLFHVGGTSFVQFTLYAGVTTIMTREADGMTLMAGIMQGHPHLPGAGRAGEGPESGPDAVKLFGRLRTFVYGASRCRTHCSRMR